MPDKEVTLKPGESVKITVPASKNPRPCLRKGDRVRLDGMFGTVESIEDMHGIWVDLEIGRRKQLTLCRYCELELIPAKPAPLSRFKPGDRVQGIGTHTGLVGSVDSIPFGGPTVNVLFDGDNEPIIVHENNLELVPAKSAPRTVTINSIERKLVTVTLEPGMTVASADWGIWKGWTSDGKPYGRVHGRDGLFVRLIEGELESLYMDKAYYDATHPIPVTPALPGEWRKVPDCDGMWISHSIARGWEGCRPVRITMGRENKPTKQQVIPSPTNIGMELHVATILPNHDRRWLRLPDAPSNARRRS